MKRCTRCGTLKPLTEFSKRSASRDGLDYKCRSCKVAASTQWALANREKRLATYKRHHELHKNERHAANKRWRQARAKEQSQRSRAWQLANPEKFAQSRRSWKQKNIERWREIKRTRRKGATPAWADKQAIRAVYGECRRLARETGVEHHVDHVIPLKHPLVCGLHVHNNLQVLPAVDNLRKSNQFVVA